MRKLVLATLLLMVCLPLSGCGGCGGGLQADLQRAAARRRTPTGDDASAPQPAGDTASDPRQGAEQLNATDAGQPVDKLPVAATSGEGPESIAVGSTASPAPPSSNEKPDGPLTEVERRARSIANLEKIGKAIEAYIAKIGRLPAAGVPRDGELLLSWRVMILPELGYPELYKRFRDTEPWDGPNNKLLLEYIPPEYQSPERFDTKTNYLGVEGAGMAIYSDGQSLRSGTSVKSMTDGVENTLAIVEVDDKFAQEWTRPLDFRPNMQLPADKLGSLRGEGAFGILATGRVVLLPKDLSPGKLAALFTAAGGEPVAAASFLQPPTAEPPPPMLATVADNPTLANLQPGETAPTEGSAEVESAAATAGRLLGSSQNSLDSTKEAVPSEEELAKARELLKELYDEEYRKARKPEAIKQFLQKLLADVPNVEAKPADYYELVRIIRDLAAATGDVPQALAACQMLAERYQMDDLQSRLQTLEKASKYPQVRDHLSTALKAVDQLQREAIEVDRYEIAIPSQDVWMSLARIQGDRAELARLSQQSDSLAASKSLYAAAQRALAGLSSNPDDASANEAIGVYLCLVKSRWEAGLPYLARAADIRLRGIASLEMSASRSLSETQSLAEQCWDLAARFKLPQRRGLQLRAVYHYALIRSKGSQGLEAVKAQRRIDEAAALYGQEEINQILAPFQPRDASEDLSSR